MRSTRTSRVVALAALCSLLVAGAALLWRPAQQADRASAPDDALAAQRGEAARRQALRAERPVFHTQVAASGRYDVEAKVALSTETGPIARAQDVALRATLEVGLPERAADRAAGWVVGTLSDVRADGDADLRKQLGLAESAPHATRFALRVDPRGEVVERRFAKGARLGERNLVAAVSAAVQVVQPAETVAQERQRWRTTEAGASSTQSAIYEDLGEGQVRKSWGRTAAQAEAQSDAEQAETVMDGGALSRGQADLRFVDMRLVRAAIAQKVVVDLALHASVRQRQQVDTTTTVAHRGPAQAAPGSTVFVDQLDKEASFAALGKRVQRASSGRTVDAVLTDSGRAQKAKNWHARRDAAHELAANLEDHPSVIGEVKALLWGGKAKADALRTAVEALGTSGDPAGRKLLAALIRDKEAPASSRWHAVALMVTLQAPEPALVDALIAVSQDEGDPVYKTAAAALAAVVHRARKKDHNAQARAYGYLMGRAEDCFALDQGQLRNPAETVSRNPTLWVMVLGNLGGAEVFPLVAPYLVDKRRTLRRHAIEAMRFIPTNQARLALVTALQRDPSQYNRRMAAETALYQPQYLMEEHVLRALREDRHPEVQLGAAWTLAVWGVTTPGLYAEIRHAADRAVNKALATALRQLARGVQYTADVKDALQAAKAVGAAAEAGKVISDTQAAGVAAAADKEQP